jgi:2'-5' RNA ligase
MRLFAAIPLPPPAADRVASVLRDLRERGWPVRWVRDGGLHLTLKFFGEVLPDRLDAIGEAVRQAGRDTGPIELVLGSAGVFPDFRRPRILRLAVRPDPGLELLQDRLERAATAIGYPPEGRPFSPHITLGRVKEGGRLPAEAAPALEAIQLPDPFVADRVVVYESRQTPQGPAYTERVVQDLA